MEFAVSRLTSTEYEVSMDVLETLFFGHVNRKNDYKGYTAICRYCGKTYGQEIIPQEEGFREKDGRFMPILP